MMQLKFIQNLFRMHSWTMEIYFLWLNHMEHTKEEIFSSLMPWFVGRKGVSLMAKMSQQES